MACELCDRPVVARGWCSQHWQRWQRQGDPTVDGRTVRQITSFTGVHSRLRKERGPASAHTCACGKPALDWAFDEPTGFSTDLSRYTPTCRSCHVRLDQGAAR